jgi:predicted PilT family ATPase
MNRRTLQQLVVESYSEGELDAQKVNKIADLLTKKELRLYIKALKNWEKQSNIAVDVPVDDHNYHAQLHRAFPDKKIVINVDPTLLLGMRLQHNDDVYEMSLKHTLNKITEHIEESYD